MALIDDIIEMASNDKEPIGNLLRKCLVLERQVRNEKFRAWLDKELDGYETKEELPSYRVFRCINKGFFVGIGGSQISDQPLPLHVMEEKDRKMVENAYLFQPAASYAGRPDAATDSHLPWNPHLTVKYQTKFISGMHLNRAWQDLPGSVIVALLEQVRTRVLRFALDIRDNLPEDAVTAAAVPADIVERSVVNNIFNGNVLIASNIEYTNQITNQNVSVGDFASLSKALEQIGINAEGIKALSDIQTEKPSSKGLGEKAKGWLADMGKYLGKEGVKVGVEVAKRAAMKWLTQYYGLDI
jgi:hypothetical protein